MCADTKRTGSADLDWGPSGPVQGPALENIANNCAPPLAEKGQKRWHRYQLRDFQRSHSSLKRCRRCGHLRTGDGVGVRYSEGQGAGFSGLTTCGSVWVCPVCSAKILARRSLEFGVVLTAHENAGGSVVFGTFTMRHHRGTPLQSEWEALQAAWHSIVRDKTWRKWKQRLGAIGHLRVVEVTYGSQGWHVHTHWALLIDSERASLVPDFRSWVVDKWRRRLAAAGFDSLEVGQDVRHLSGLDAAVNLGNYFAKNTVGESVGRELFGSWTKKGRTPYSTRPAWQLLEDAYLGDVDALRLWHDYENVSQGRRQMNLSHGLRQRFGLEPEKSDEEIAGESAGDVDLVRITPRGWFAILKKSWHEVAVLDVVERDGLDGLVAFLTAEGIEFEVM